MMNESPDSIPFIIAEAGVNHDGRLDRASDLVDAAADAGADAVKFQTFRAKDLASGSATKAEYQQRDGDPDESQLDMLRRLELPPSAFARLADRCRERGIEFLSSPFDEGSLDVLLELGIQRIKVGSGDLTNAPLLRRLGQSDRPVILSTGMATLGEVETALAIFAAGALERQGIPFDPRSALVSKAGRDVLDCHVVLLHCTSEYPAPVHEVNLRAMDTLRAAFDLPVGLSDHTEGIAIAIAAAARGASVLEKHVTLDRTAPGPDHAASLEPRELAEMIARVRDVARALGSGRKIPSASEADTAAAARKSLVTAVPIRAGTPFSEQNMTIKRPGTGISASRYYEWLGRSALRDYDRDELIDA